MLSYWQNRIHFSVSRPPILSGVHIFFLGIKEVEVHKDLKRDHFEICYFSASATYKFSSLNTSAGAHGGNFTAYDEDPIGFHSVVEVKGQGYSVLGYIHMSKGHGAIAFFLTDISLKLGLYSLYVYYVYISRF